MQLQNPQLKPFIYISLVYLISSSLSQYKLLDNALLIKGQIHLKNSFLWVNLGITLILIKLRMMKHYPTEPSSLRLNKRSASDANSKGNSLKTSLQKPLTIRETASSVSIPRCNK